MADDLSKTIFAYASPVVVRANGDAANQEDLLKIAKQRAPDPDALDEFPPFFFDVTPSTNALDSYFSRMKPSSLKNYAADFAEGRAFQDSHRHDEQPLGYSLTGKYIGTQGNGIARVDSSFFIPRGLTPNGDATINRIRTGATKDVSIGFYGGQWICSICGRDMMSDWDCWHIPGMSYTPDQKDMDFFFANNPETRAPSKEAKEAAVPSICEAGVENGHAAECSGVFDGATPGAVIRAQTLADMGHLTPVAARSIETRYHVRIFGADQGWRGWTPPNTQAAQAAQRTTSPKEGSEMTFEEEVRAELGLSADANALDAVRALKERGETGKSAMDGYRAVVKALGAPDDADAAMWSRSEIEKLRPLADDGKQYRSDLVDDAIAEGVRAHGADFKEDDYRGVLTSAPIATIKRFRDDWKVVGDKNFAPGRQTGDGDSGAGPVDISSGRKASKRAVARV